MVSTVTSHRNRSAARDYGGLFPFDLLSSRMTVMREKKETKPLYDSVLFFSPPLTRFSGGDCVFRPARNKRWGEKAAGGSGI